MSKKRPWEANHWTKGDKIGQGGQGETSLATRESDPSRYVIKELLRSKDPERRGRLRAEAKAMQQLRHPCIAELVEHNTDEEDPDVVLYLVTKYISGETLENYVRKKLQRPLNLAEAMQITLQILNTLEYCHQQGIVHRDIKHDNVIIDDNGNAILIDFGLSFDKATEEEVGLTAKSLELGNRFIVLPELRMHDGHVDDKRDTRSDICAVAGIFFFMLTGEIPGMLLDHIDKRPHQRPNAVSALSKAIDPGKLTRLLGFFDKAFQYGISHRFNNIAEMRIGLFFVIENEIPGLNYFRTIAQSLGVMPVDADTNLDLELRRGSPLPGSTPQHRVWIFQIAVIAVNNADVDNGDYHFDVYFPIELLSKNKDEVERNSTHARLRFPRVNWHLKAGQKQGIGEINCLIDTKVIAQREAILASDITVEPFNQGKSLGMRRIPMSQLDPFGVMNIAV